MHLLNSLMNSVCSSSCLLDFRISSLCCLVAWLHENVEVSTFNAHLISSLEIHLRTAGLKEFVQMWWCYKSSWLLSIPALANP
jgi:hypothetical protein